MNAVLSPKERMAIPAQDMLLRSISGYLLNWAV